MLACSGGVDSSALVLALAGVPGAVELFKVIHVRHDLRPAPEADADAELAARLAARCGLGFSQISVQVASLPGNDEANARRARYDALGRVARSNDSEFVATAHQGHDQLETLLMRLARGAGPRGMAGIRERRSLGEAVCVVRPMLGLGRNECEALCAEAGHVPAHDRTNKDLSRTRAAIRARVVPALEAIAPAIRGRSLDTARAMADSDALIRRLARDLAGDAESWSRDDLRKTSPALVSELIRSAGTASGTSRELRKALRMIRDDSTEPREIRVGDVCIKVTAREVSITQRTG